MSIPQSIQDDAFNLDGAAQVFLFKLVLPDLTLICLSPRGTYTWQGDVYEEIPCHMSQVSRNGDGEMSRPKFSVVNPQGMFTAAVNTRVLENSSLTRHRMMKTDLLADSPLALSETFRVSRIANVSKEVIVLELRGALDGSNFKLPTRSFHPPEFPHVKLS